MSGAGSSRFWVPDTLVPLVFFFAMPGKDRASDAGTPAGGNEAAADVTRKDRGPLDGGGLAREKLLGEWEGNLKDGGIFALKFTDKLVVVSVLDAGINRVKARVAADWVSAGDVRSLQGGTTSAESLEAARWAKLNVVPALGSGGFSIGSTAYKVDAQKNEVGFGFPELTARAKPTSDAALLVSGEFKTANFTCTVPETRLERVKPGAGAKTPPGPPPSKDPSRAKDESLNCQGKWTGKENTGLHVRLIYFETNEFPCRGNVVVQYRSGSVIGHDIIWERKDGELTAVMREGESSVIAKVKTGQTLSGKVFLLVPEGRNTEIDFADFTKASEPPDSHESLMKEVPLLLAQVTNVLRTVQDEATAKQAAPKIAVLVQRLQAIKRKADALPKPSPEEEKRLQKIYTEDAKPPTDEMNNELSRVFAIPGVRAALAEPIGEFRKLKTPVTAPAREKAQARNPWRRLLLEDKVFTPEQIKQLEKVGGVDVSRVIENSDQTQWTIHLTPLPKMPIPLDSVIKLYGQPDKVTPLELLDEKLARFEAEAHHWGPIALVTKKGQKEVIAFVASGAMFKKGLKKSAEE